MTTKLNVKLCDKTPNLGLNYEGETSEPISQPLKTIDAVLSWQPGEDEYNVATQAIVKKTVNSKPKPRTLICHDMAGGYLKDRFAQGTNTSDYYHHYHWQYLDSFIYFSHYFVTIPPPGWTNTAHKHGVLMLGTLITEWNDGLQRCQEFLKDEDSYRALADKMVEITKYYNFDGWLVNIENKIEPEKVNNLHGFMKYLTHKLHVVIPHSQVLWYDSVIKDGTLSWQDELNDKNRMFFDVCDGIFLNYTWNEKKLKKSVLMAGPRQHDVYVGVDVFGRNCFGGGGWNTNKAMKVICEQQLSTAIFAPGWVYERMGSENFLVNQNRFWELLSEFCSPHGIASLPLVTSFCHGFGNEYYKDGLVVKSKPWGNMSLQQLQPTELYDESKASNTECTLSYCTDTAYYGGGCLQISGIITPKQCSLSRIFSTDIAVTHPLLVSYTVQISSDVDVFMYFKCNSGQKLVALINSTEDDKQVQSIVSDYGIHFSEKEAKSSIPGLDSLAPSCIVYSALTGESHSMLHTACSGVQAVKYNDTKWRSRFFLIPSSEFESHEHIEEIGMCMYPNLQHQSTDLSTSMLMLGQIQILNPESIKENSLQISDLKISQEHWKTKMDERDTILLSATLTWTYPPSIASHFDVYCVGLVRDPHSNKKIDSSTRVFIGSAFVNMYRVCDLSVPYNQSERMQSVKFLVQPVMYSGLRSILDSCTEVKMEYSY
ncbi:cytosolic endo-beta-N-acetylglucosaminidase-like [Glandiceps talaboti]